eukprot:IDg2147t1
MLSCSRGIKSSPAVPDNEVARHVAQGFPRCWSLEPLYLHEVSSAIRPSVVADNFVRDLDGFRSTIDK